MKQKMKDYYFEAELLKGYCCPGGGVYDKIKFEFPMTDEECVAVRRFYKGNDTCNYKDLQKDEALREVYNRIYEALIDYYNGELLSVEFDAEFYFPESFIDGTDKFDKPIYEHEPIDDSEYEEGIGLVCPVCDSHNIGVLDDECRCFHCRHKGYLEDFIDPYYEEEEEF